MPPGRVSVTAVARRESPVVQAVSKASSASRFRCIAESFLKRAEG
jgi:hypothetical protein